MGVCGGRALSQQTHTPLAQTQTQTPCTHTHTAVVLVFLDLSHHVLDFVVRQTYLHRGHFGLIHLDEDLNHLLLSLVSRHVLLNLFALFFLSVPSFLLSSFSLSYRLSFSLTFLSLFSLVSFSFLHCLFCSLLLFVMVVLLCAAAVLADMRQYLAVLAFRPPATDTAQIVNEGVRSDVRHDTLHDNPVVCFLSDSRC